MFTVSNLPILLSLIPIIAWLLGQASRLSMLDWLRPATDFLNIILFLGPMLLYDYIGWIRFNVLNTATQPLWHDLLYVATVSLIFYGVGKLALLVFVK